jgi:hypothetical protein
MLAVERLKPRAVRYEKRDGLQGLYLIVQPSGKKAGPLDTGLAGGRGN